MEFEFIDPETNQSIPTSETSDFLNSFYANVDKRKHPRNDLFQDKHVNEGDSEIRVMSLPEVQRLITRIDISKDSCIERFLLIMF